MSPARSTNILGLGAALPEHAIKQTDAAKAAAACCGADARQARILADLYRRTTVRRRYSTLLRPTADGAINADSLRWFYVPLGTAEPSAQPPALALDDDALFVSELQSTAAPAAIAAGGPSTAQRMQWFDAQAPRLAERAARAALDDAATPAERITHLVVVTCTGFSAPGVDVQLIRRLGLRPDVTRAQIGYMGCHGAINGLQAGRAFAASESAACVLVCCVELCSLHFQYGWESDLVTSNALFADGAAGAVLGLGEDGGSVALRSFRSLVLDGSDDLMTWQIGDQGFAMTLSSRVPQVIGGRVRAWVEQWLAAERLGIADIAGWAIHPGGPRVVASVGEALGLSEDQLEPSRHILRNCGNMSSATVLFILQQLCRQGCDGPIVMMSFGPGLTCEAVLLETHARFGDSAPLGWR